MKKVAAVTAIAIAAYSIYYDLTIGTLSLKQAVKATSQVNGYQDTEQTGSMPYEIIETVTGDTVISIAETIHDGPLPVSIDQLIQDFKTLNKNVEPDEIQLNKEYKFPVYRSTND